VTEVSPYSKIEAGNVLLRSVGAIVEKHEHGTTLEELIEASMQQRNEAHLKLEVATGVPRSLGHSSTARY
jgi:hypothetical protein